MKAKAVILIVAVILLAVVFGTAGARSEVTDHERINALETRVANLENCNPTTCDYPAAAPTLGLPPGMAGHGTDPTVTETVAPTETTPPIVTTAPPVPGTTPTAVGKQACNQGRGNGSENCDPGNSNHNQPSNDELPCNRGGKCVP